MPNDPFYNSLAWKRLRSARLGLDRHACVVPGCGQRATKVDHVIARRAGGLDTIANTRSLCAEHDHAIKELPGGKRRGGGKLVARGCFADGSPRDPSHPWFTGAKGVRS
jgi:5-methylcytosine-specific restriction endonuclease McrA